MSLGTAACCDCCVCGGSCAYGIVMVVGLLILFEAVAAVVAYYDGRLSSRRRL